MATLKLRHLILFAICFVLLILSDMPGGAMLSLFAWMQLCILLWNKEYSLRNQIKFLFLFLFLLPTYFLWGAVNSFISIYAKESHFIFIFMYGILSFFLCFWITLFSVFGFAYAKDGQPILSLFAQCTQHIKEHKFVFLYTSLIVYMIAILPIPLPEDYRIVMGIVAAHLFLKKDQIKSII